MLKKKKLNRVIAVILSIIFALSVFPTSESIAAESLFDYATETDADDIDKSDTDTMTDEKNTEAVVEAEASETVTEETTTEELTTEETVEEVAEEVQTEPIPTFNVTYEGVNISGKDFSSCELLIATEDPGIFTYDTEVVSEYNGIYLTRYPDASKTMNAYTYYYTKAPLVEVNTNNFKGADEEGNEQAEEEPSDDGNEPKPEEVIETSPEEVTEEVTEPSSVPTEEIPNDGHGEADLSNLNNGDDAFSNVNDLGTGGYSGYIALIDTGANGADASVSVIGSTSDDNGHGTKMAAKIREMNPNARILSIKALDSSNRGRVSDIYSAINYAIDSNVSIINLSLTSLNTADSELVVSAIQQAINRGIVVVGAAGNYGSDASYFVPGCVSNAIICTATDETGVRLGNANFGSNIDYYVIAGSTSEAAATVSGLISRDGLNFYSDLVRKEEGMFSTESDADVDEIDSDKKEPKFDNLGDNASDEAEELNSQAELNEYLSEHFKWLGGVFKGQAPSGYPDSFNADVWFNQTSDRANADGVIGYLSNWNIRGGISTSGYDFVAGSQAVYCGCVARGVASVSHSYTNTTGGHTHYSGPNSGQEHLCITPGVQAGNWNNLQITNTTFAYVDQVTYNGQSYARYKTTDGVDQYLDTAGVQYVDIYVYVRKTSQPGFISLHKSGKKANGAVSNLSRDGIVYGLYDDEHLDSAGNNKIAEFTLGADGYPKSIQVTTARATAGVDGPITGDDGHLYLKWISEVTPQNWYFKEISSNNNYQLDPNKIPVSYTWTTVMKEVSDFEILPTYVTLKKTSSNPTCTNNNPNYNLNGTTYGLYTSAANASNKSNAIHTFTVNAAGNTTAWNVSSYMAKDATTGAYRATTFYLRELTAGPGYEVSNSITSITVQPNNSVNNPATANVSDKPLLDPVFLNINKQNLDGTSIPEGTGSLEGAQFTIKYYALSVSNNYTAVQLSAMTPDAKWTIQTKKSSNLGIFLTNLHPDYLVGSSNSPFFYENGNTNPMLPLGWITIEETKAPDGYTNEDVQFKLNSRGTISNYDGQIMAAKTDVNGSLIVSNQPCNGEITVLEKPIRGDFEILKQNYDGEALAGVEFSITNNDTGESYDITTDENGRYSSEDSGLWFSLKKDGTKTDKIYGLRGLPYGTYTLTETIPLDGYQKEESITFDVTDSIVYKVYDLGRGDGLQLITDMELPTLGTRALVETKEGETKVLPAAPNQKIHDICSYTNLRAGTEYTLIGKLMEVQTDGSVEPFISGGEEVTGITHFTTANAYEKSLYEATGEEIVEFADLDFTGKEGISFVVFERLYLGNITEEDIESGAYEKNYPSNNDIVEFPLIHEDPLDSEQTVTVPNGHTDAYVVSNGSKTAYPGKVDLTDIVYYEGLEPGKEYTLKSNIYIYEDDELMKNEDGEVREWTSKFVPAEANGQTEVTVTLDLSDYQNKTLVFFEEVKDKDIRMFINADIEDIPESIHIPRIKTSAYGVDELKVVYANDDITSFSDSIDFVNLEGSTEYTAVGYIMDAATGKPIEQDGKPLTARSTFTTPASNRGNNGVDGVAEVVFEFKNARDILAGKEIVIFEELYIGETTEKESLIAEHKDLKDKEQKLKFIKIGTLAYDKEDNDKVFIPDGKYELVDEVSYYNIDIDGEYKLVGTLMDKKTGQPFLDKNGNPIESTTEFTTKDPAGKINVDFVFETDLTNISLVVFEELYIKKDGKWYLVEQHKDINDEGQSVKIGSKTVKTGDTIPFVPIIIFMFAAFAGIVAIIITRKNKKSDK